MHTERGWLPRELGRMRHSGQHGAATLRKGWGSSSPPSDTTKAQVTAFSDPGNRPFGATVEPRYEAARKTARQPSRSLLG